MNTIVTGALNATPSDLNTLRSLGLDITLHPDEQHTVAHPEQYEAAICNALFLHNDISAFTNLKYIQLTSVGLERVPLDYIREHGITLHNARDVYSIPMAEFAVCGVLQLCKQSRFFLENQKQHHWEKHRGLTELVGKTVCIVGCGSVGNACADRFAAFGCRIIGVSRSLRENSRYDRMYPVLQLHDALALADISALALPLTAETRHLIDRDALNAMKPGAILVNLARGAIVDTGAMIEALNDRLGGAVLDVFEEEPLSTGSPLWDMEHVILTPHNSFVGDGDHRRLMEVMCRNLIQFF